MPELTASVEIAQEILSRMRANTSSGLWHGVLAGEKGDGKTLSILTLPRPVLIHSFDPSGTETLRAYLHSQGKDISDPSLGILIDNRFEQDSIVNPQAYLLWEQEYNRLGRTKFFEKLGSYVIDSLTTWMTSCLWQIMRKEGRMPASMNSKSDLTKNGMQIQDWGTVLNVAITLARSLGALPCHSLLTAHLAREKDELTQSFINMLAIPGQGKDQVPINLSELYVLRKTPKVINGERVVERCFQTASDSQYKASTRIGAGVFKAEEEPDFRKLIKKAGGKWEDKPQPWFS